MTQLDELYHEEEKALSLFEEKSRSNSINRKDVAAFTESYRDLLAQSKVMTRVSDRLQSKLNKANEKIADQNTVISAKNVSLTSTIDQLVKARVSKKATTILFTVAIVLFISEEVLLAKLIEGYVDLAIVSLAIKGAIALALKAMEGTLENYFMKQEQMKILKPKEKSLFSGYATNFAASLAAN